MSENNKKSKRLKDAIKRSIWRWITRKKISKDRFDEVINDKNIFLEIFSPWHKKEGKELIEGFVNNVKDDNSTNDFSWLDILNADERWKKSGNDKEIKENKKKYTNMRYQIPTHFHGDIDNAVLFYCMENPRGYLGDYKDSEIDEEFQGETLNEFYIYSANKRLEESKTLKKIVKERYQLNDVTIDLINKIIYSGAKNGSPLARDWILRLWLLKFLMKKLQL